MKKSTITILLVLTALVFTSCLTSTTASSLSMGQNAKDGSAYLIGSFHTELLNEKILPKGKDFGYITFVGLSGDSEGQEIKRKISRNDVFFLELPAGEYLLKSITYFDVIDVESLGSLSFGKGMRVTPVNTFTAGTTVDLSDSSFTYIGDITFVNKTNPYGISEKTIAVYDNYQSILSDEWLLDGSGRAISPENKSGETVMGSALYDPFNYQIGNGRLSFDKDTALETSAGGRYSYAPDKSIAFISVDNNYGSWAIASEMKKYALETYNTKVVDSQSMARVLPQYPALTPTPLN
ncbi:MAG: hypothetical protein PQJ50_01635, partial [Spirochaetales bacterium]|nr:hypothetical protein [Spirochaetales bacterium]